MILELIAAGALISQWVYHRYFEARAATYFPKRDVAIPITEDGAPIPMLYGRTRVRSPVLAWAAAPQYNDPNYEMNMLLLLGSGFAGGTNMVHGIWAGDWPLNWTESVPITGVGGPEFPIIVIGTSRNGNLGTGLLEFINGNSSQVLAGDSDTLSTAPTTAGRFMLKPTTTSGGGGLTVDQIPGYRGFLGVFLYGNIGGPVGTPASQWAFGASATVPNYNFDASSYAPSTYPGGTAIANDANPVDILYDLWTNKRARAGVDATAYINTTNWTEVAAALKAESFGLSYFWDGSQSMEEYSTEVLKTIDGTVYENPSTGKLELKLVRNDYVPSRQPHIHRENCVDIVNFTLAGRTNIINRVRVVFLDADAGYIESSVTAENPANTTGEGEHINEVVLRYLGITNRVRAQKVADRELAVRSRTFIKCRAIVNREFHDLTPGTAVRVTWTDPDIAGLMFRVCAVDRGTLKDSRIAVDLLQDWFRPHRSVNGSPYPAPEPALYRDRAELLKR